MIIFAELQINASGKETTRRSVDNPRNEMTALFAHLQSHGAGIAT